MRPSFVHRVIGSAATTVPLRGRATMDRPHTFKEIAKITAGAVASLVIVGWIMVLAIAFMSAR